MSLDHALLLLEQYGYIILFPLAILEGPIVTIIAGLLITGGMLSAPLVYVVVVAGDIVGDTFWYAVGRYGGGPITRLLERMFGITQKKIDLAKHKIERNHFKMTAVFKFSQGIGFAGLIAAGLVRVPYLVFITACLVITLAQSAGYLLIGLAFGSAYQRIGSYFDYVALGTIVVGLCALLIWYFWKKRTS